MDGGKSTEGRSRGRDTEQDSKAEEKARQGMPMFSFVLCQVASLQPWGNDGCLHWKFTLHSSRNLSVKDHPILM